MRHSFLWIFLSLAALQTAVHAQAPSPTPTPADLPPGRTAQWRCSLPGGTYTVALRAITAVAIHEYLVDGAARVTEVNIDTDGSALARFYYLEPITPQTPSGIGQSVLNKAQELATEAASRTGQEELWKKVVKNYPATTHARTIEYRLDSKEQLQKIFTSADRALREFKDTALTIQ